MIEVINGQVVRILSTKISQLASRVIKWVTNQVEIESVNCIATPGPWKMKMSGQWFKFSATRSVVTLIFFPPWSTAKLSTYFTAVDLTSSVFKRPAADNISPILPHLSTAALSTGCAFGRLLPLWIFETSLRKTRQLCAAHCCHYVTTVPSSNLATLSDAFLLFFFFLEWRNCLWIAAREMSHISAEFLLLEARTWPVYRWGRNRHVRCVF